MSISLNDHENRIKRLESAGRGGYSETNLFSGAAGGNITLNDSVDKYDMIYLDYYHGSQARGGNKCLVIPVSRLKTRNIDIFMGGDGVSTLSRHIDLSLSGNNMFLISPYDTPGLTIYRVIGIKFGGGYKRPLQKIKTHFNHFLEHIKEVLL